MFIPSGDYDGPATPTGYIPHYQTNAVICYFINLSLAMIIFTYFSDIFPLHLFFNHLTSFIIGATLYGQLFTMYFYIKGRFYSYWPPDLEITGNFIYDYWKGIYVDLYPYLSYISIHIHLA